jgi:hypothetical protein
MMLTVDYAGKHNFRSHHNAGRLPPNMPMQLTPLRVPKIGAFLKVSSSPNVIPIYRWRRN